MGKYLFYPKSGVVHAGGLRHIHLYLFSDLSTKELLTPSRIPFQLILKSVTMVEVAQLFQNFRIVHAKCTRHGIGRLCKS